MNKPTPGPWECKTTPGSDHEFCTVYAKGGRAIARHVLPEDAAVIIAVHDLLAACEATVLAARQSDSASGAVAATLAEAAIAKAKKGGT